MIDRSAPNNGQIPGHRLDQSGFPCPVRSDDGPLFIAPDLPGGIFENKTISQPDRDMIQRQKRLREIFLIQKSSWSMTPKKGLSSSRDTMPSLTTTGGSVVTSRTVEPFTSRCLATVQNQINVLADEPPSPPLRLSTEVHLTGSHLCL